jgi:hypothetical protein
MKQVHIRFGNSSASDTKDSDQGDPAGLVNLDEALIDADDPGHFL